MPPACSEPANGSLHYSLVIETHTRCPVSHVSSLNGSIGKFDAVGACCARPGRMQYAPTNNATDLPIKSLNGSIGK